MHKRIKVLRQNMNMSQKQFANHIGIAPILLSEYENDKTIIPESVIDKICSIFFVDKLWLLYGASVNNIRSRLKRNIIATIASTDDILFNDMILNLSNFLKLEMEDNIEKKILSYQNELESEKKGLTYTVSLNINVIEIDFLLPQVKITWDFLLYTAEFILSFIYPRKFIAHL